MDIGILVLLLIYLFLGWMALADCVGAIRTRRYALLVHGLGAFLLCVNAGWWYNANIINTAVETGPARSILFFFNLILTIASSRVLGRYLREHNLTFLDYLLFRVPQPRD